GVYDTTSLRAEDLAAALRRTTAVLSEAGIDVEWLTCGPLKFSHPSACDAPIASDELAVRLVSLPGKPSRTGALPLGYSLVDTASAAGALATVFVNRIQWLTSHVPCDAHTTRGGDNAPAACDAETLLGFAMAHEIGHLLLGTNDHGTAGLMRAVWSPIELQRNDPADWLFTRAESTAMVRA